MNARIEGLLRVLERVRARSTNEPPLPFGHMRLETGDRVVEVLLSSENRAVDGVSILDWETAGLADVFFSCAEGERYEIERGASVLEGRLLEHNLLRFRNGALVGVEGGGARFLRGEDGRWLEEPSALHPRLERRPRSARRTKGPSIDFALDDSQRRAVALPSDRTVLVLGEAGCGKTTVGLHRLVHLRRASRKPLRCAVIVPTEGLRRLVELLLRKLNARDVDVWLYDRWAARQAHHAFPDIPRREGEDASAGTIRLKRHPALRFALEEIAARPAALPTDDEEAVIPSSARARRHDLQHLFGDRALLQRVAERSEGAITRGAVDETFEHTRVQFCPAAEDELAYVDPARLKALDGRKLDEGTPTADAATIDAEDYAVLFELDRLRAERDGTRPTAPLAHDLILLDEAQEFSPLELTLIGRSLAPGGTLIVSGDADQQVDPAACFLGWERTMSALDVHSHETATLDVSYRCPEDVTTFSRLVLAPARAPSLKTRRSLSLASFDGDFHLAAWLIDALRDLQARDRCASVAVICRTPQAARRLSKIVRRGVATRVALDGTFSFHAGINVTCVQEVKGLEFDVAIVPDANPTAYPDTLEARRALYVAVTRPMRQLVVATSGAWSPIVPIVDRERRR